MIKSFRCGETQALYEGKNVRRFANFRSVAERKLQMLDSASTLDFLRSPPGNRLEALKGNRAGQHSIRVNSQWRICFVWTTEGPEYVEIVDYH
ncbi:type II toxin-antitoxin system RelE/ParE family toxin [uncultured Castellaniella sp.]|uniref:type II toxin-antitoxin system RelE/ParE family toxin n=1 Tax=uncultured Castellaniella sp. TaxID=647907 RepID=UPI0026373AA1|nr:type II toxin-antitoxin system RelE/ParE family toxin [uncultured Castellaniella sp.]